MIPTPTDAQYVGFSLAFIFCILNAFQGVFIFIWAVVLRKLQLKHLTKSKYKSHYNSNETASSNTDNQNYRKDVSTENTYYNVNLENSEMRDDGQKNFELNVLNRKNQRNDYVNIDQKGLARNISDRDEYNRKSVKTLIRKNEILSKEIDLSKVHLEYHEKTNK